MVGRGLRSLPGKKNCYILDLGGNHDRHDPIVALTRKSYMIDYIDKERELAPSKLCPDDPDKASPSPGMMFPDKFSDAPAVGCGCTIHASLQACPNCGYAFPVKDLSIVKTEDMMVIDHHNSRDDKLAELREQQKLEEIILHQHKEEKRIFYISKRIASFRKGQKPTVAFAAFISEYDEYPDKSWNKGLITKDGTENLPEFFTWVCNWAFEAKETPQEIYKAFNMQVGMEFGTYDCKMLPQQIKEIARRIFQTAVENHKAKSSH